MYYGANLPKCLPPKDRRTSPVDFPEPDGPTMATKEPGSTARETEDTGTRTSGVDATNLRRGFFLQRGVNVLEHTRLPVMNPA